MPSVYKFVMLVILLCGKEALGQYEIVDLGSRGYKNHRAYAINELGQVVGTGGLFYDPLSGDNTIPISGFGINDLAYVAGQQGQPSVASVYYGEDNIVNVSSGGLDIAFDINNNNQVTGSYLTDELSQHAFIFDSVEGFLDIGASGLQYSYALSINDSGLAVGYSRDSDPEGDWRAFLYTLSGGWVDISTSMSNTVFSIAHAVNESGLIAGRIGTDFSDCLPFVYDSKTGTYQILDTLGVNMSGALGVNDLGQVVGYYATKYNPEEKDIRPFFWDGQIMIDLNNWLDADSGWTMTYAYDVNNDGWIVGCGIAPDGNEHACLIRPIPEPSLLMFLAFGVPGLLYRRDRFRLSTFMRAKSARAARGGAGKDRESLLNHFMPTGGDRT